MEDPQAREHSSVAESEDKQKKRRQLWTIGLVLTGVLICAGGVFLGTWLTSTPADNTTDNSAAVSDTTADASVNPQSENVLPEESQVFTDTQPSASNTAAVDSTLSAPISANEVANAFADPEQAATGTGADEQDIDPIAAHIALADEELRAGSYANALRTYSFAIDHVSGTARAAVLYRLALCSEGLGNFMEANEKYGQITRQFSALPWAALGRMGEARCLAATGRVESLSAGAMRETLLDQTVYSPRIRGELLHICGRAFCQKFMPDGVDNLLNDHGMILPQWNLDPNRELDLVGTYLKDVPPLKKPASFAVLQQTDRLPDSTFVKAHTHASDVQTLLKVVVTRSGFEFDISETAQAATLGRTQQLYVDDISLSLLLDGLCAPFGLVWWHDQSGIHVVSSAEADGPALVAYQQEAGQRLLSNALVVAPDSAQAGYSRVSLGILQYLYGSPVDAAYTFQMQMELEPRSEVEAEAAFNQAKCYLQTGELERAREAFLKAVDSASYQMDARIGAYLYVGRLQIEEGLFQPAVSSMVRALALCHGTDLEEQAALLLASAYIMADSPQGATSVLMDRRDAFQGRQANAAAFLSALSRFQAAVLPGPKERAGRSLVTALTRFKPQLEFGSHWSYLHAVACEEIGLTQQAIESYTDTIKHLPAAPLRDRAMIKLASQYRYDNRLDEAAALLAGVNADRKDSLGQRVTMQAALVSLEKGDGPTAVRHCRHIVNATEDKQLQKAALQVMGRAYEMQNKHKAAVYCFAGMLPAEDPGEQKSAPSTAVDMTQDDWREK